MILAATGQHRPGVVSSAGLSCLEVTRNEGYLQDTLFMDVRPTYRSHFLLLLQIAV